MTTPQTKLRRVATLKLPLSAPALADAARGIVHLMTDNPFFPDPDPTLQTVQAAISEFEDAQVATHTRTRGTVEARNEKRGELRTLLDYLRVYVQKVADANSDLATSIIESAGMHVHKPTSHGKFRFHVAPGAVSGVMKLTAETPSELAFYDWQYSTDGAKTWQEADSTLQAHTTISGFTRGERVFFRFRAVTRAGKGDWSQPVSIIVT